jgi:tetratricopeptide (TPR) repeat protein
MFPAAAGCIRPKLAFTAGRYLEIQGKLEEAAQVWERIAVNYPSRTSLFRRILRGILHFRRGDLTAAVNSLNRAVLLALDPWKQRGIPLAGKVSQSQGTLKKPTSTGIQLSRRPTGYYGLRALELLEAWKQFTSPENAEPAHRHDQRARGGRRLDANLLYLPRK